MTKELEELFIKRLNQLSDKALNIIKKHIADGRKEGLACNHYGRAISCLMSVKTILFSHNFASVIGSQREFFQLYLNDLPETFPKNIDVFKRNMKETHAIIRFTLFQSFFAQTEFTFRIIQRNKFPLAGNINAFKFIAEKYGIMKGDAPSFLVDLRNSIHNNGHYFPNDCQDKEYIFLGKKYKFINGHPIKLVNMVDTLDICNYLIDETSNLFSDSDLAAIKFQ